MIRIAGIRPHLEVYGSSRRFIELGNEFIRRRHRFTIYHSDGEKPRWLEFLGQTKPVEKVLEDENDIAICNDHNLLYFLENAKAKISF